MKYIALLSFCILTIFLHSDTTLTPKEALALGQRVWKNESGGSIEGLTWWNPNEDFASMGIGHFLWYPKGRKRAYKETFPQLLLYLKTQGVSIPKWLDKSNIACPWNNKKEFDKALNSKRMNQIRNLLKDTVPRQAAFIAKRLNESLPRMLNSLSGNEKEHVEKMFSMLSETPQGIYALADYINFKGEGMHTGESWGLKYVLLGMPDDTKHTQAVWEFVRSAKKLLLKRVLGTPQRSGERRWLLGWKNRLDSYLSEE